MFVANEIGKLSDNRQRHFIITRKIGHHIDIPGSDNWQLHCDKLEQCFVCDRKQYTFFIWSPDIPDCINLPEH
jgi:hypothetical protein